MGNFVPVASLADLPPGSVRAVDAGRHALALFHHDGRIHALADMCPHSGGPLSEGEVEAGAVACPWHGATFDLASGACVGGLDCGPTRSYPTRTAEGRIEVELPD